ncbi:MAG: hypothetical protein LBS79_03815, partial [Tannerella sp.]|nr:hypothetical protein [Tannerella sp.]
MDENFATHYFKRYKSLPPFFCDKPDERLGVVVIIPCIDDEFVFDTLDSLENANAIRAGIEVIVNVNSGESTPPDIIEKNRMIFDGLKRRAETGFYKNFRLLPILVEGTVKKKAGVGFARKTAMDEALRRFAAINRPDGLIVSLDADTLVAKNYFQEMEKASGISRAKCFTFQFRHDYDMEKYPENVIQACKLYEIYLRYYRLALKTFNFPFAVHTIGSCFAIRACTYAQLGGMASKQGGEDFYFLQKAAKMHPVHEVMSQIVFPSPRVSNRVPFGTGPSVRNILENGRYTVYNFELFRLLKVFYELFPAMERTDRKDKIPAEIMGYIGNGLFDETLAECRTYSASSEAFVKRMYDKFDAFFVVKFLNTFNDNNSAYPPVDVREAGKILLNCYGVAETEDLYETITKLDI